MLRFSSSPVLGFVAISVSLLAQQAPPPRDAAATQAPPRIGTASISGTVVDGVSGEPIRRATVIAAEQAGGFGGRMTVTGDDGQFAFKGLPAGRYIVTGTKAAYLATANGANKPMRPGSAPTGSAIALTDGQQVMDVALRMIRGSIVTGVVRGTDGQPLRGASVSLAYSLRAPLTGQRTMAFVPAGSATTDARGVYRLFGVPPGEYVASVRLAEMNAGVVSNGLESTTEADVRRITEVLAARSAGRAPATSVPATGASAAVLSRRPTYGYATVFYPGTTSLSNATPITLGPGEERGGIDFQIQLIPQSRVSGVVTGADGKPAAGIMVRMSEPAPYAAGPFLAWMTATTDAKGEYQVRAVPAGDYVVEVRPSYTPYAPGRGAAAATAWARTTVSVAPNEDARLNITLQPGLTIAGQIAIDPASTPGAPLDFTRARVGLMSRDGVMSQAVPNADGRFTITGVLPDVYRLMVGMPPATPAAAWFPKSGVIGGRDALDGMIEVTGDIANAAIVLTTRVSEVSGSILDGAGRPTPEYFLVIFPADRALWSWQSRRIQQARPASDGRFTFRNLPAGEYLLGAVTDLEQNQLYEPAFLGELLAVSVKISLADGERKTQDIRLR